MADPQTADFPGEIHVGITTTNNADEKLGGTTPTHSEHHEKLDKEIIETQKKIGEGQSYASDAGEGQVLTKEGTSTLWKDPPAGVTAHGDLTGLDADDHAQYHTDERGDARYYTKSETDGLIAYSEFVYNSSLTLVQCAARGPFVFNDWALLMAAKSPWSTDIIFEQDESIPSVGMPADGWDLDYAYLVGNNLAEYNAGGWTVTFPEGTKIGGNLWKGARGIRVLSTATTHNIWTPTAAYTWISDTVCNIHATTVPFVGSSAAGQNIIALRNSGRFQKLSGGVEMFHFTGGAFAQTIILSRGDGAVVTDNTLKSDNAVVFLDIVGSTNQAMANYPSTHSGMTVGFELDLFLTSALALAFDPTGTDFDPGNTTVDAILREIDTRLTGGGL